VHILLASFPSQFTKCYTALRVTRQMKRFNWQTCLSVIHYLLFSILSKLVQTFIKSTEYFASQTIWELSAVIIASMVVITGWLSRFLSTALFSSTSKLLTPNMWWWYIAVLVKHLSTLQWVHLRVNGICVNVKSFYPQKMNNIILLLMVCFERNIMWTYLVFINDVTMTSF